MENLCRLIGERLDRSTETGRRVLDWPGKADTLSDALPLRLTGGLHALVRGGAAPELGRIADRSPARACGRRWPVLPNRALRSGSTAPRTNEVASAVLMTG